MYVLDEYCGWQKTFAIAMPAKTVSSLKNSRSIFFSVPEAIPSTSSSSVHCVSDETLRELREAMRNVFLCILYVETSNCLFQKSNSCELCQLPMQSVNDLLLHMESHPEGLIPQCYLCAKKGQHVYVLPLSVHGACFMRIIYSPMSSLVDFVQHMKTHNRRREMSGKKYTLVGFLNFDVKFSSRFNRLFQCEYCSMFSPTELFARHIFYECDKVTTFVCNKPIWKFQG